MKFRLEISYRTLSVFWPDLENPFNDWNSQHVEQGFAWRRGSVSFSTMFGDGTKDVCVNVIDNRPEVRGESARVIDVPFEQIGTSIEIASISQSEIVEIEPGLYSLRCEIVPDYLKEEEKIFLTLFKNPSPTFVIIRADRELSPPDKLLTHATSATP